MPELPRFFDSHSHLQDRAFDADREEVIARMKERGVFSVVVGTDFEMSQNAVALAEKHTNLFAAVGLHPRDTPEEKKRDGGFGFDTEKYRALAAHPKVVAIGECGLDYFRMGAGDQESREGKREEELELEREKNRQREIFLAQIALAGEVNKPLIIHSRSREAHNDLLEILAEKKKDKKENQGKKREKLRGIIHFFTESEEIARKYLALGFALSFSGVISFAREYDAAICAAPANMILSETDSPYAAPVPYRGKRNEPIFMEETVKKLAVVRGISGASESEQEKFREQLVANAERIFGIL